jgi:hypothetical protein
MSIGTQNPKYIISGMNGVVIVPPVVSTHANPNTVVPSNNISNLPISILQNLSINN